MHKTVEYRTASLREFCEDALAKLKEAKKEWWAAVFVKLRMDLQAQYLRGLVLSTSHGVNIFENILAGLNGVQWEEKGELGNNFRLLINCEKNN